MVIEALFKHVAAAAEVCKIYSASGICIDSLPHKGAAGQNDIQNVLSVTFAILGGVAVIMVIIGGINYAGSQGDPGGTTKAKNTIIYALVGVAIALFGVTIVQIVVPRIFS